MQAKQVVFSLPKFSGQKGQLCEPCQLGKQHRLPLPNTLFEPQQARFDPFRCVGTNIECEHWREPMFRRLHRRLHSAYLGLFVRGKRSLLLLSEGESLVEWANRRNIKWQRSDGRKENFSGSSWVNCRRKEDGGNSLTHTNHTNVHVFIHILIHITHTRQPLYSVPPLYLPVQLLRVTYGSPNSRLGNECVPLRSSTWYQVSSCLPFRLICIPTRYQVSNWGPYGDELDTWYRVWVHLHRNSIPSIELGLISGKIPIFNDIRP